MTTLESLDTEAWEQLAQSADNRAGPLRTLTLSTTDANNHPQSRLLILRVADRVQRSLWFHTDLRSCKWQELRANPRVSVLGYDPEQQLQLRFSGSATLHPPKTELTTKAWSGLPEWTRQTYCGPPPGETISNTATETAGDRMTDTGVGYDVFCVVVIRVSSMDWFRHERENIRRRQFDYDQAGRLSKAIEVAP
jgi:hypothetical protein